MVSLRLNNSPRVPSFSGPIALATALLCVVCFSEPFWQNFFILRADSANVTMKVGAWGVCTRLRNNTNVVGDSAWCTSKQSGFNLNFIRNSTAGGINQFPSFVGTTLDEATLFGTTGQAGDEILTSGMTSLLWFQVITAICSLVTLLSLICPPSYLGSPQSRLFAFQKSGIAPVLLAITTCVLAFVTFIIDLIVILPAKGRLNDIPGIEAEWGNTLWFTLPGAILFLPALFSVLMRSTRNEYADL